MNNILFLVFQLGKDSYALASSQIVQVLSRFEVNPFPEAPHGVVGLLTYRGTPVPVIDLNLVASDPPLASRSGTWIIVVRNPNAPDQLLALLAERATETLRCRLRDFKEASPDTRKAPHWGPVVAQLHRLIQWIQPDRLLNHATRQSIARQLEKIH
jgi:chemotaxis-related protein WspB